MTKEIETLNERLEAVEKDVKKAKGKVAKIKDLEEDGQSLLGRVGKVETDITRLIAAFDAMRASIEEYNNRVLSKGTRVNDGQ